MFSKRLINSFIKNNIIVPKFTQISKYQKIINIESKHNKKIKIKSKNLYTYYFGRIC